MSMQMKRVADDIIEALSKSGDDVAKKVTAHLRKHKRKLDDVSTNTKRTDREMAHRTPRHDPGRDRTHPVSVRAFRLNPRHDRTEFNRQFNEQMDTLENMSMADWIRNRNRHLYEGRNNASLSAQEAARANARREMIAELRSRNVDRRDAEAAADAWLSTQAATHRLDGVGGGDVTDVSGVGDSNVNSSLGSQWSSRVGAIDEAIAEFARDNPGVDLSTIFLDINFT